MKIAVIGAGAIGGYVGARLALAEPYRTAAPYRTRPSPAEPPGEPSAFVHA